MSGDLAADLWAGRLRAIARLTRVDALAVLTPAGGQPAPTAAHNLGADGAWAQGQAEQLAALAIAQATIQHRPGLTLSLADGRVGRSALAVPLMWAGRPLGALLLVRADEAFARTDAEPASRAGELVALELTAAAELGQATGRAAESEARVRAAETDRLHAVTLYEIARLTAGGGDRAEATARAVAILADLLTLDLVSILAGGADGFLRPLASHGYRGEGPGPLRANGDALLLRVSLALRTETARFGPADVPTWAGMSSDVLVAPIVAGGLGRGVLILGRSGRPFSQPEGELAPTLAASLAPLLTGTAPRSPEPWSATPDSWPQAVEPTAPVEPWSAPAEAAPPAGGKRDTTPAAGGKRGAAPAPAAPDAALAAAR